MTSVLLSDLVERDLEAVREIMHEWRDKNPGIQYLHEFVFKHEYRDVDASHSIEQTAKLADPVTTEAVKRGLYVVGEDMNLMDYMDAGPTGVAKLAHVALYSQHKAERELARRMYNHMMMLLPLPKRVVQVLPLPKRVVQEGAIGLLVTAVLLICTIVILATVGHDTERLPSNQ